MGTARPTLYHVLHDDNKFSSDDIQQLTYWVSQLARSFIVFQRENDY